MEKIGARAAFWIWAIVGILAILGIWFLPWSFMTNDDELMMWLVSGAYTGQPEAYAVFIHPVLSLIFAQLYAVFPVLPWYPLFWFFALGMAYVVILKLFWREDRSVLLTHSWSLFLFCLITHFSFFLHFSIVAALLTAAGLMARMMQKGGKFFALRLYWTDLLILLGFMIRFEVAFLLIAGLVGVSLLMQKSELRRGLLLPLVFLTFFQLVTEFGMRQQGSGDFLRMNRLRSEVFDDPVLQLQKESFREVQPDLYHFGNGLMDFHQDELTIQKLEGWRDQLGQKRASLYSPTMLWKSASVYLGYQWFLLGFFALFWIFSLFILGTRGLFLSLFLFVSAVLLSPFYLLKVQVVLLLFLVYFLACFLLAEMRPPRFPIAISSLVLILLFGVIIHLKAFFDKDSSNPNSERLELLLAELSFMPDSDIYLIGAGDLLSHFHQFRPLPFGILGWATLWEANKGVFPARQTFYLVEKDTYTRFPAYFDQELVGRELNGDFILLRLE